MQDTEDHTQSTSHFWDRVFLILPLLKKSEVDEVGQTEAFSVSDEQLEDIIRSICQHNQNEIIEDLVIETVERKLRQEIVPSFWKIFTSCDSEYDGFLRFDRAITTLYNDCVGLYKTLDLLEIMRTRCGYEQQCVIYGKSHLRDSFKVMLRATLWSQLPRKYTRIIEDFYKVSFRAFGNPVKSLGLDHDELVDDDAICLGCNREMELCHCENIIEAFNRTNSHLLELDILERMAGEVITTLLQIRIQDHVQDTCHKNVTTSYLVSLETWLNKVVMGWLGRVYESSTDPLSVQESINEFEQKLFHFLYDTYTRTRIDQLFNIIIEYPESHPVVEDLKVCVEKTDLRGFLSQKLHNSFLTRLLHPGVNTSDVLTAYISAIKALRYLDPSGVLLETVTQPIKKYLRSRDDTVRCVVCSLTDEGPNDLSEELMKSDGVQVDENAGSDDDAEDWENWNPVPVDAAPSKFKSLRTSDIISMLVNLYGSKEMFVNEYRTLLADRLLNNPSCNTDKEIRYLELLKLRFGEAHLHYCEVMLKDVYDSKRINMHLHSDTNFNLEQQSFPVSALIVSAQFWPPFRDDSFELPEFMKNQLDIYTKAYETLKGNRTLCWKPTMGTVTMEIELKERTLNLSVPPVQAVILWNFLEKDQWTVEELSQVMRIPSTVLRRKIAFWQTQGVLREVSTDTFLLIEECPPKSRYSFPPDLNLEEEDMDSALASSQDQRDEELQTFWTYIMGMLTNLDSLTLERIHQMLKMFASQNPSSECGIDELRHFLDSKVRAHQLIYSGGQYRLPKS